MIITNKKTYELKLKGIATEYNTIKDFVFKVGDNNILDVDLGALEKNKYFRYWSNEKFLVKKKPPSPQLPVKKESNDGNVKN